LHRKRLEREGLKGFVLASPKNIKISQCHLQSFFSLTGTRSHILATGRARVGPYHTTAKKRGFLPFYFFYFSSPVTGNVAKW
jgi:hypothetical protein